MESKIHNVAIEQCVLYTIMEVKDSIELVINLLDRDCFYAERHKLIFDSIMELHAESKVHDSIMVEQHLIAVGRIDQIGGSEYLLQLMSDSPSSFYNLESYSSQLIKLKEHREVEIVGRRIEKVANDLSQVDVYSSAEMLLGQKDSKSTKLKTSFNAKDSMESLIERMIEKSRQKYEGDDSYGAKFGIKSLDDKIGSIDAGHFCIIAGREGSGKSTLAQIMAITNMLRYGKSCLFISAEMDKETLMARILSSYSKIPFMNIQRGIVYDGMFEQLTTAKLTIDEFKLIIEEKQMPTLSDIRSYIRKAKRKHSDLGLVIVDYIGLIKDPTQKDRRLEMDSISRNLKAMGKEFGVPMIVLAQLNRENVKVNREPRSSDLKESGQLEADCDQIVLVHPVVENEEPTGMTKLIISKNRHGEKGSVHVMNRLDICKFVDVDQGDN